MDECRKYKTTRDDSMYKHLQLSYPGGINYEINLDNAEVPSRGLFKKIKENFWEMKKNCGMPETVHYNWRRWGEQIKYNLTKQSIGRGMEIDRENKDDSVLRSEFDI